MLQESPPASKQETYSKKNRRTRHTQKNANHKQSPRQLRSVDKSIRCFQSLFFFFFFLLNNSHESMYRSIFRHLADMKKKMKKKRRESRRLGYRPSCTASLYVWCFFLRRRRFDLSQKAKGGGSVRIKRKQSELCRYSLTEKIEVNRVSTPFELRKGVYIVTYQVGVLYDCRVSL